MPLRALIAILATLALPAAVTGVFESFVHRCCADIAEGSCTTPPADGATLLRDNPTIFMLVATRSTALEEDMGVPLPTPRDLNDDQRVGEDAAPAALAPTCCDADAVTGVNAITGAVTGAGAGVVDEPPGHLGAAEDVDVFSKSKCSGCCHLTRGFPPGGEGDPAPAPALAG